MWVLIILTADWGSSAFTATDLASCQSQYLQFAGYSSIPVQEARCERVGTTDRVYIVKDGKPFVVRQ
jgi:hypothetical protein